MLPKSIQNLIEDFAQLPGVGPKTATRLALQVMRFPQNYAQSFADHLVSARSKLKICKICNNYSDSDTCDICLSQSRDQNKILVVESPLDVLSFESAAYDGLYHVLGGLISPLQGIGPAEINAESFFSRLKSNQTEEGSMEIIFALPTSLEGDSTLSYLIKHLQDTEEITNFKISKLGRGLPSNSHIDYQDPKTLQDALLSRIATN